MLDAQPARIALVENHLTDMLTAAMARMATCRRFIAWEWHWM
jgi:hypothetical protein